MAVKLFLKHLFTSIKRRPAQPFVLVAVLTVAITVCMVIVDMGIYVKSNQIGEVAATYGKADYSLSVSSASSERFILVEKVKEILPQGVDVCGLYGLPAFLSEDFYIDAVATDFSDVNSIIDIDFFEELPIKHEDISSAVFITNDLSQEKGINIGDKIDITILGKQIEFKVCGIAKRLYFAKYDIMIDTSSLVQMIAGDSIIVNFLDDFCPCSSLLINSNDKTQGTLDALAAAYPDMTITRVSDTWGDGFREANNLVTLVEVFCVFFVVIVVYCCFHILSAGRNEENLLFAATGTKTYMLDCLSAFELFLYWIVGMCFGTLLCTPIATWYVDVCEFVYCNIELHPLSMGLAGFLTLFATEMSLLLFIFIRTQSKKMAKKSKKEDVASETVIGDNLNNSNGKNIHNKRNKRIAKKEDKKESNRNNIRNKNLILCFSLLALGLALCLISYKCVKDKPKLIFGLSSFLCFASFAFLGGKTFHKILAKKLSTSKRLSVSLRYAFKNSYVVGTLGNTAGLVALLLTVVFATSLVLWTGEETIEKQLKPLNCDYLVVNAGKDTLDTLKTIEDINVYSIYNDFIEVKNTNMIFVAADNPEVFFDYTDIGDTLPSGNHAYMCAMFVRDFGYSEGETFSVTIGNQVLNLVLEKRMEYVCDFVVIDNNYWDIPYNYVAIKVVNGGDKDTILKDIKSKLVFDSATVIPTTDFNKKLVRRSNSGLKAGYFMLWAILAFSVIGIGDNIIASYRSRREQFFFYSSAGMSRGNLRKMKFYETLFSFLVGIITFLLVVGLLFFAVYNLMVVFNIDFFWVMF